MSELNGSNFKDGNVSSYNAAMSHPSASVIITKTAFYTLILLASLFGNALVIHIASRTRTAQNAATINLLIANMATSDLLISIFAIPRKIIEIHTRQGEWLLAGLAGQISCKCIYFFQDISTAVSIQSLVVISLDRFVAVVFPYRRPLMGATGCKFVVIPLIWVVAVASHSPYFYTFRIIEKGLDGTVWCISSWEPAFPNHKTQEAYYIVLLVLLIILPLLVITILYSVIISQLRVKNRKCSQSAHTFQRLREDSKVIKKIIAIILVYILCLTPIHVCALLYYFVWNWEPPRGLEALMFASYFILFSNSAINPLLYFTFNERYRHELRNLMKKFHLFRYDDSTGVERHTSTNLGTETTV